jgi:acyl carrier protein
MQTRDQIRQSFITLVLSFVDGTRAITDQTSLISDLALNSVKLVDLVLATEDAFDIEIQSESMDQMYTVGSAVEMIWQKKRTHT